MARPLDLSSLTSALEGAARRHAAARRQEAERELSRLELATLLRRFGLDREVLSDAVARDDAGHLPAAEATVLRARVRGELSLLARLARRRDLRYDINRHIAVVRLSRWLEAGRPWHAKETAPGPGRVGTRRSRPAGKPMARRHLA